MALVESLISEQLPPRSEPAIAPLYVPPLTAADYGFASGASTPNTVASPAIPMSRSFDETTAMSTSSAQQRSAPLRKGKWTPEEEAFTSRIIHDFTNGYLPLAPGTTLRSYLSEKLNCDPMRITKKFAGAACIGKQVFQPCEQTQENAARIAEAQEARASAERLFNSRLEHAKCPRKSALSGLSMVHYEYQTKEMASLTFLASSESMGNRPSFLKPRGEDSVMSDTAAGGLLLDFFAAVRRRASYDDGEKTAQDGSTTNGSESDDSESERGRKRALSMPDLAVASAPAPDESMADEEGPCRAEIKRTKSLSDLELRESMTSEYSGPITTCA